MPPLVCPSLIILDNSFPRDDEELRVVSVALGQLSECVQCNELRVLFTPGLRDFIAEFDWSDAANTPLKLEIYRLLNKWLLQQNVAVVLIQLPDVEVCDEHPTPVRCEDYRLIEFWTHELGGLLRLHDQCVNDGSFFIGVACPYAFVGEPTPGYRPDYSERRKFPLVGRDTGLADAYVWEVPPNMKDRAISYDEARKNCFVLGASRIDKPSGGGSHYKVRFAGAPRPWILDSNLNPVPEEYLKELELITGFPLEVVIYVLAHGTPAVKKLRILGRLQD